MGTESAVSGSSGGDAVGMIFIVLTVTMLGVLLSLLSVVGLVLRYRAAASAKAAQAWERALEKKDCNSTEVVVAGVNWHLQHL